MENVSSSSPELPVLSVPSISRELIKKEVPANGGIGFFAHATDWESVKIVFNNIGNRTQLLDESLFNFGPIVSSRIKFKDQTIGANIITPMPCDVWVKSHSKLRDFRNNHYLPGLDLAAQCNISILSLGGLVPYASKYGTLRNDNSKPYLTTGHASTVSAICSTAERCCVESNINLHESTLAVFGAGGAMGSLLVEFLLNQLPPRALRLIEIPSRMKHLEKFKESLLSSFCDVTIHEFSATSRMPQFDGAILVTNHTSPFLNSEQLKRARFWVDDSHPRSASLESELETRNDTKYVECYLRGPKGLELGFPYPLPHKEDCYACFAEGFVAWREGISSDFIVGRPTFSDVEKVRSLLEGHGFSTPPLTGKSGEYLK